MSLLQTTGGKDEPNIVFMRTSQHGTKYVKKHNRTTQKTKYMSTRDQHVLNFDMLVI